MHIEHAKNNFIKKFDFSMPWGLKKIFSNIALSKDYFVTFYICTVSYAESETNFAHMSAKLLKNLNLF